MLQRAERSRPPDECPPGRPGRPILGRRLRRVAGLLPARCVLGTCAMPSRKHEALLELLERCPELAVHLLREQGHLRTPRDAAPEPTELHADLVLEIGSPPIAALVLEHQLGRDPDKRFSWPAYVASLHHQLRCPVLLVVFAFDPEVAAWARETIDTFQPGSGFAPLVLDRTAIPRIDDPGEAARWPELAVLSAYAHADAEDGFAVALAAAEATTVVERERAKLYFSFLLGLLPEAAAKLLRDIMQTQKPKFYSDIEREIFERGQAEGIEIERKRTALRRLVEDRLGTLPDAIAARIETTTDLATIDQWLATVAEAPDAGAVAALFA
jgi:hypothetical protein